MAAILEELRRDHVVQGRLLKRLEREIQALRMASDFNLTLLSDLADFFEHYSSDVHHPIEDLLYSQLLAVLTEGCKRVPDLNREHQHLALLTRQFHLLIKRVCAGQFVVRAHLINVADNYLLVSRTHMEIEERQVFPMIEDVFTARQWGHTEMQIQALKLPIAALPGQPRHRDALREREMMLMRCDRN